MVSSEHHRESCGYPVEGPGRYGWVEEKVVMKTIVHFGAGNIGRSLVGQLFSRAGYEVVFVDAVERVIDALNERREYQVVVKDTLPEGTLDTIDVKNVRGLSAFDADAVAEAIASADLISTAVGPAVLPRLAPTMAKGIAKRSEPITIIMCENLRDASEMMREKLAENLPEGFDVKGMVGLVETSIGKMVPIMPVDVTEQDPLVIWAEAYNQIVADRAGFIGTPPEVPGLVLKESFKAYVDRKLFIHNLGHAVSAYFGYLAGKERIWECMADEGIRSQARAAMWASAKALIARYPQEFNEDNQREHVDDLLNRFANRALNDSVFRVGRDLYRKLSAEDRCVGALRLVRSCGLDCDPIHRAMAAALCFKAVDETGRMHPDDEKFQQSLAEQGPRAMLETVCGLDAETEAESIEAILRYYQDFAKA